MINEAFECAHCGHLNPKAPRTCRNHCRKCLWSLHVDKENPGDRVSECGAKMRPVKVQGDIDNIRILHRCTKCDKEIWNKKAEDDDMEVVLKLSGKR